MWTFCFGNFTVKREESESKVENGGSRSPDLKFWYFDLPTPMIILKSYVCSWPPTEFRPRSAVLKGMLAIRAPLLFNDTRPSWTNADREVSYNVFFRATFKQWSCLQEYGVQSLGLYPSAWHLRIPVFCHERCHGRARVCQRSSRPASPCKQRIYVSSYFNLILLDCIPCTTIWS